MWGPSLEPSLPSYNFLKYCMLFAFTISSITLFLSSITVYMHVHHYQNISIILTNIRVICNYNPYTKVPMFFKLQVKLPLYISQVFLPFFKLQFIE